MKGEHSFLRHQLWRCISNYFCCAYCPALTQQPLYSPPLLHSFQESRKSNTPSQATLIGAAHLDPSEPFLGPLGGSPASVHRVRQWNWEQVLGQCAGDLRDRQLAIHTRPQGATTRMTPSSLSLHIKALPHLSWRPHVRCGFTYWPLLEGWGADPGGVLLVVYMWSWFS